MKNGYCYGTQNVWSINCESKGLVICVYVFVVKVFLNSAIVPSLIITIVA